MRCAYVCAQSLSHVWLLETPRTVARQAPLSLGFSGQARCNGLPGRPPGDLPHPGIKLESCVSPASAGSFFPTGPPTFPQPPVKLQVSSFLWVGPWAIHCRKWPQKAHALGWPAVNSTVPSSRSHPSVTWPIEGPCDVCRLNTDLKKKKKRNNLMTQDWAFKWIS